MTQKTVLITGANRGVGLALTKEYLNAGAKVLATCRTPDNAEELQTLAKDNPALSIEQLDITSDKSRKAIAAKLDGTAIDILINNAGIYTGTDKQYNVGNDYSGEDFGTLDPKAWEVIMRTNAIAPVMVTQELLPCLQNGNDKKIMFISSGMGSITNLNRPGNIGYRTSKTALNTAMKCVALHLQLQGFAVAAMHPGWVRTRMGTDEATLSPEGSAQKICKMIDTLTAGKTGGFYDIDGEVLPW